MFLVEQQRFMQLVTLIGHIRDMFKLLDDALGMGEAVYVPLQDFYAARSHIMHEPRMPVRVNDGLLMVPKIAMQNAAFGEWDDKSIWDEVDLNSFVFFADFCRTLRDEFSKLIGSLHPKIYPAADNYFDGRRIVDMPSGEALPVEAISGTCIVPAISAFSIAVSGITMPTQRGH